MPQHCTGRELRGSSLPSILQNGCESLLSDGEFLFTDARLKGPVLDPDGLQTNEERNTLQVRYPRNRYLPRSPTPCYALVNKLSNYSHSALLIGR